MPPKYYAYSLYTDFLLWFDISERNSKYLRGMSDFRDEGRMTYHLRAPAAVSRLFCPEQQLGRILALLQLSL